MEELNWHEIIKSWKASGQSQWRYCQEHGLNYHQFKNHRQKGLQSGRYLSASRNAITKPQRFSPVEVVNRSGSTAAVSSGQVIELILPHGIILRIPAC